MEVRACSGVSLLEVMFALAILAFGLLAASAGQIAALKSLRESRSQTDSMYLARQQMESFQSMSSDDVIAAIGDPNYPDDPSNPIDPHPADNEFSQYNRRWFIQQDDPEPGSLSIRVEVDYVDRIGVTRTTVLQSLKAEL